MPIGNTESDYFDLVSKGPDFGAVPKFKILVEGDSWVSHPLLSNLTQQFDGLGDDEFAILDIAQPGDTAIDMFEKNGRQLKKLDSLLVNRRFGYKFDMIFLSAAGNDIVGPEILEFVDEHETGGRTGADLINGKYDAIIDRLVTNYKNVLRIRAKSTINKTTPVICHCYGYLKPRLVGTKVFGAAFGKGWVKRYLDQKDIPEDDQEAVVRAMMDRFYDAISALEDEFDNFLIVDTRRVLLKRGKPDLSLWHDEIHPTGKGFKKVAKAIKKAAVAKGMWPD